MVSLRVSQRTSLTDEKESLSSPSPACDARGREGLWHVWGGRGGAPCSRLLLSCSVLGCYRHQTRRVVSEQAGEHGRACAGQTCLARLAGRAGCMPSPRDPPSMSPLCGPTDLFCSSAMQAVQHRRLITKDGLVWSSTCHCYGGSPGGGGRPPSCCCRHSSASRRRHGGRSASCRCHGGRGASGHCHSGCSTSSHCHRHRGRTTSCSDRHICLLWQGLDLLTVPVTMLRMTSA